MRTPEYTLAHALRSMVRMAVVVGIAYVVIAALLVHRFMVLLGPSGTLANAVGMVLPQLAMTGSMAGALLVAMPLVYRLTNDPSFRETIQSFRRIFPATSTNKASEKPTPVPRQPQSPRAAALTGLWEHPHQSPRSARIRAALADCRASDERAAVVCLGREAVCENPDEVFEPAVFPQPVTNRDSSPVWLQLVIAAPMLYFAYKAYAPGFVAAVLFCAMWPYTIGRLMNRRYVRLAPGVIEFIRYPLFGSGPPKTRRYPMSEGTLVVAVGAQHQQRRPTKPQSSPALNSSTPSHVGFTFVRDGTTDGISVSFAPQPAELCDAIWRAVMSTAPAHRMSETELVG